MKLAAAFGGVRAALERAGVAFAVGGSWASTVHGEARATNDLDLIADFTWGGLQKFLDFLGPDFYCDAAQAREAFGQGRPFNVIHQGMVYKFDFFPVRTAHGEEELGRRRFVLLPMLGEEPVPVVTAEDTIVAKLRWYREGGEVSERQWRDVLGVVRAAGEGLDREYVERWVGRLRLEELWGRVLAEVEREA